MPEQILASLKPLERDRHTAQSLPPPPSPKPTLIPRCHFSAPSSITTASLPSQCGNSLDGPQRSCSPFGVHLAQPICHQSPGAQGTQGTGKGHIQEKPAQELDTIPLPLLEKPCLAFNCSRAIISLLLCQGRCHSSPGLPRCCLTSQNTQTEGSQQHAIQPHFHDMTAYSHSQHPSKPVHSI